MTGRGFECRLVASEIRIRTGTAPSISGIQRALGLKWRGQAQRAVDDAIRAGYLRRGCKGLILMDGAHNLSVGGTFQKQ